MTEKKDKKKAEKLVTKEQRLKKVNKLKEEVLKKDGDKVKAMVIIIYV